MAGFQKGGGGGVGGREKVIFEREVRSLGSGRSQRSRFTLSLQLEFNFPPPSPLYAGHVG